MIGKRLKLRFLSNESMLRIIFQSDSPARNFRKERGDFSGNGAIRKILKEGVFSAGVTFHGGVSCERKEGEPE